MDFHYNCYWEWQILYTNIYPPSFHTCSILGTVNFVPNELTHVFPFLYPSETANFIPEQLSCVFPFLFVIETANFIPEKLSGILPYLEQPIYFQTTVPCISNYVTHTVFGLQFGPVSYVDRILFRFCIVFTTVVCTYCSGGFGFEASETSFT